MIKTYPKRTLLGLSLFIGQAFLYNSILFGFATLLSTFFHARPENGPYYLVRSPSEICSARSFSARCSTPSAASR